MKKRISIIFLLSTINTFSQTIKLSDTIEMHINKHNTMFVNAIFNEKDTLKLNFDTGTTELILTNDVLNNKLKSKTELYNKLYNLQIGNIQYKSKVYNAELSGQGTDGRFGWDFFKENIVEINYDKGYLIIHSELPQYVKFDKKFTKLKIEMWKDLFFIKCEIKENGIINNNLFLFDTGFQRTAMLDNDLLKEGQFPTEKMKIIKKVIMKGAKGNEIPVITANLQKLQIGKYILKTIPVQITTTQKPLKDKNVHILGNEILKKFTVFLDFKNNIVYMKPSKFYNEKYIDERKNGT
ncbi:clan AA aspartic protease [Flavobacterium sp.]|uniref:clan AA aspartic protease n=1 Tax=Flavobacterium sp. TaxID=239 RepID=UPI002487B4AA|nr:clan AA aspartic protease [Flavobacterium sp.]MDI1318025.1 clan AA aspartic protease [Flavobacterium sp.]